MSENNLFQFAQVIAELPIQNTTPNSSHQQTSNYNSRYLQIRKNACVVCAVCFTCSKFYGANCNCQEAQPRRGKNLPEGGLDSRAKKLHPEDGDDYEFSIEWINENAHQAYKDENNTVLGLRDLSEVSLCKAHSSTLYRAKKRHERSKDRGAHHPPSPADSVVEHNYLNNSPYSTHSTITSGGLAAKVREISSHQYNQPQVLRTNDVPDFSRMSHSTSVKRKRIQKPSHKISNLDHHHHQQHRPSSSISTPLFASNRINTNNNPYMQPPPPLFGPTSISTNLPMSQDFQQHVQQQVQSQQMHIPSQQQMMDNFPSQLPPLHSSPVSQSQLNQRQLYHQHAQHHTKRSPMTKTERSPMVKTERSAPSSPVIEAMEISSPPPPPTKVIETVSLKSNASDSMYYFRNLAITDSFTFRDLLAEIDMTGSPPAGKRIVISDSEKFYPLDQAIRNVIRRPNSTHVELCLGLTDKPSINWNNYA